MPSLCQTRVHGSLEWSSLRMLEWKSFTAYNIEVLVQSPQRELMVLFKVLLISCPPRCTFSPPSWTGSQAHITEYSETSLRVFLSQQMQLHQQTRQPGKPHYFIHSFLDQIDKVQGPAALNSSPPAGAWHAAAPIFCTHRNREPREPFPGRDVGDDDA